MELERLENLIDQYFDDSLSADAKRQFEDALLASEDARALFWDRTQFHGLIRESYEVRQGRSLTLAGRPSTFISLSASPSPACFSSNQPLVATPPPRFLATAYHGAVGFFSQEIPFACLITTIIMGIAGVIGLNTTKEHYTQLPWKSVASADRSYAAPETELEAADKANAAVKEESMQWVGQITGKVDCVWADDSTAPTWHKFGMNDKFELKSGLVEITYYCGAKVILQGPCTYEVDSAAGGYLSLGKLTARIENKGAGKAVASGQWSVASESTGEAVDSGEWLVTSESTESRNPQIPKSPNPSSPAPRPQSPASLFAVRTPTAVVTDLGTEFGVAIDMEGNTTSHVFHGLVRLEVISIHGETGPTSRVLRANESAQVKNDGKGRPAIVRSVTLDPAAFVRAEQIRIAASESRLKPFRRWQAFSEKLRRDPSLLAYYDFQQQDGRPTVLPNVASNGDRSLDGVIEGVTWSVGRMAGKQALHFQWPSHHVSVNIPKKVDDLTLVAWINVRWFEYPFNGLLMSESWQKTGLMHWQLLSDGIVSFTIWNQEDCTYLSPALFLDKQLNRWVQTAVVYDHAALAVKFYHDGKVVGEETIKNHVPICIGPAWIGHWKDVGMAGNSPSVRNFHGRMDELAIFGRALSSEEIQGLFEAGNPAGAASDAKAARAEAQENSANQSGLGNSNPGN